MLTRRIIPCLDVASGKVIRGIKFSADKVVGDPVERDRLSRQSRCESEQYSVAAYARKLEDLYADLARRSPAPELRARKEFA